MTECLHYSRLPDGQVQCELCPHACVIAEGKRGLCRARQNEGGTLVALTYGRVCSTAMDPVEKKPLYHFLPGREILSIGTWGCNLRCAFCQNSDISQHEVPTRETTPEALIGMAKERGSIGIAYTYNEPLIGWEWVRDCARAFHAAGLKNVVVTNGFINPDPLTELLPEIDAMNIDIKAFHEGFYKELCGGRLAPVREAARIAARGCHVEVTTLVIPGYNDAPRELDELAAWVASECGRETPAHLSAYFPRYKMNVEATSSEILQHAREIFSKHLDYVYLGNVAHGEGSNSLCRGCDAVLVHRRGYSIDDSGLKADGACARCGVQNAFVLN